MTTASTPSSSYKIWYFRAAMLALPLLFFLALEGGLRLLGYGATYPLFIPFEQDGRYLHPNPEVARRFFANTQALPTPNADLFLKQKPENTLRIVVQGESSAAGYPYYHGGAFSNMLKQRLKNTYPNQNIEVINTGMAAINSFALLDFADEIAAIQPDAILIYTGHNEYYGALGVGSAESLGKFPAFIRWYLKFKDLRVIQLLRNVLSQMAGWFGGEKAGAPSTTLMERMVGEQSIPLDSPLFTLGKQQFEENMGLLLERYQSAGIPVYVSSIASNEADHAPFISLLKPSTNLSQWQNLAQEVETALQNQDRTTVLSKAEALLKMDETSAKAYFLWGKALQLTADSTHRSQQNDIRNAFERARDLDALRFRAPTVFNQVLKDLAPKHGAYFVDAKGFLDAASPQGRIGKTLMLEHLHPNMEGYLIISEAFYQALLQNLKRPQAPNLVPFQAARSLVIYSKIDSLFAGYRIQQLTASWPFKPFGTIDHSLDHVQGRTPEEAIALKLFRRETSWYGALEEAITYYRSQGQFRKALQTGFALLDAYDASPYPWFALSQTYVAANDLKQAQTCLEEAARRAKPEEVIQFYNTIGQNLLVKQQFPAAIAVFETSLQKQESLEALKNLGTLLLQSSQSTHNMAERKRAISYLEKARTLSPQDKQVLYNLTGAYAMSGQLAQAQETIGAYLQLVPNDADALALRQRLRQTP